MIEHELKINVECWHYVQQNLKRCEIRYNDRNYQVNDQLLLRAHNGDHYVEELNTLRRRITHIVPGGQHGIESGYVLMSIE